MKGKLIKLGKEFGLTQLETLSLVNEFIQAIKEEVELNGKAELRGFGRFTTKLQKGRRSNLPSTGGAPAIKKLVVKFKASDSWSKKIN